MCTKIIEAGAKSLPLPSGISAIFWNSGNRLSIVALRTCRYIWWVRIRKENKRKLSAHFWSDKSFKLPPLRTLYVLKTYREQYTNSTYFVVSPLLHTIEKMIGNKKVSPGRGHTPFTEKYHIHDCKECHKISCTSSLLIFLESNLFRKAILSCHELSLKSINRFRKSHPCIDERCRGFDPSKYWRMFGFYWRRLRLESDPIFVTYRANSWPSNFLQVTLTVVW